MTKVKIDGCHCERCGHEWAQRDKTKEPVVCPKCKSPYWNTPRLVKPNGSNATPGDSE